MLTIGSGTGEVRMILMIPQTSISPWMDFNLSNSTAGSCRMRNIGTCCSLQRRAMKEYKVHSLSLAIIFPVLITNAEPGTLLLQYTEICSLAHCPTVYIGITGMPSSSPSLPTSSTPLFIGIIQQMSLWPCC